MTENASKLSRIFVRFVSIGSGSDLRIVEPYEIWKGLVDKESKGHGADIVKIWELCLQGSAYGGSTS